MSDLMLIGVLRLPRCAWSHSQLDEMQRHSRYIEAADRIESDADRIAVLEAALKEARVLLEGPYGYEGTSLHQKWTARRDAFLGWSESETEGDDGVPLDKRTHQNKASTAPSDAGLQSPTPRGTLPNTLGATETKGE